MHTVNEEAFLQWYRRTAKKPGSAEAALQRVFDAYVERGSEVFELSAEETKDGAAARYAFRAESIGCCGASTMYFYF